MKKIALWTFYLSLVFLISVMSYGYTKKGAFLQSVRQFTEAELQRWVKADVFVGDISFDIFKGARLSGLSMQRDEERPERMIEIDYIKSVLYQNRIWRLLMQRYDPELITIDSPNIRFTVGGEEIQLFKWTSIFTWKIPTIAVTNGVAEFNVTDGEKILFSDIASRVKHRKGSEYDFAAGSNLAGLIVGVWEWRGSLNQADETIDSTLELTDVDFADSSIAAITGIEGSIHITESRLSFEKLKFKLNGISFQATGFFDHPGDSSQFSLTLEPLLTASQVKLELKGDLVTKLISGHLQSFESSYDFEGLIEINERELSLYNGRASNGFLFDAILSLEQRAFWFQVLNGSSSLHVDAQRRGLGWNVYLDINHFRFFDFDWVFRGEVDLIPKDLTFGALFPKVEGTIRTDYLIFNYLPLDEFTGRFVVRETGETDIQCMWGNIYQLEGNLFYREGWMSEMKLLIDEMPLDEVRQFIHQPIQFPMEGELSGEMRIEGALENPQFIGNLGVGAGRLAELKFDEARIHFEGNREKLELSDSKATKSARSYYLTGDIDFTKHNVFSDVDIHTSEGVTIWRGESIGTGNEMNGFGLARSVAERMILDGAARRGHGTVGYDQPMYRIGMEYEMDSGQTVRVQKDDRRDESVLDFRHRIQF